MDAKTLRKTDDQWMIKGDLQAVLAEQQNGFPESLNMQQEYFSMIDGNDINEGTSEQRRKRGRAQ